MRAEVRHSEFSAGWQDIRDDVGEITVQQEPVPVAANCQLEGEKQRCCEERPALGPNLKARPIVLMPCCRLGKPDGRADAGYVCALCKRPVQ